jgi:hypothetical protein
LKQYSTKSISYAVDIPTIIESQKNDMGVQASPMTSLNESSELADSYDSETAKIFKTSEVKLSLPKMEVEQTIQESESYMIRNSETSSESNNSDEIMQSSSSEYQSESLSSGSGHLNLNQKPQLQKMAVVVSNKKNQDELKITFSPMMKRDEIENVDDLSDLEEFYLTEIEQQ